MMENSGGITALAAAAAERLLVAAEQRSMRMLYMSRLLEPRQCGVVLRCRARACNDWKAIRWLGSEQGAADYFKRNRGRLTAGALAVWWDGKIKLIAVAKPRLRSGE